MRSMFWPAVLILAIFAYVAFNGVHIPTFENLFTLGR
jgi:hypothetical protein